MITAGFDIGTRVIKACIVDDGKIVGWSKSTLEDRIDKVIENAFSSALDKAGVKKGKVEKILATGYCSEMLKGKIHPVSEALCISKAAYLLDKKIRTVIDIGGLSINIITIDDNGHLKDTISNDRCAAGSGKFLEMVSEATEISMSSISSSVMASERPCSIKSNCAVFAESEVISRINAGHDGNDIVASVLYSIASRAVTLLEKISAPDDMVLIGGVSKIGVLRSILENLAARNIAELPADPQIISALGAALIAQGKMI
jgi:predicted CoA-substrate-specific enzyme activase